MLLCVLSTMVMKLLRKEEFKVVGNRNQDAGDSMQFGDSCHEIVEWPLA